MQGGRSSNSVGKKTCLSGTARVERCRRDNRTKAERCHWGRIDNRVIQPGGQEANLADLTAVVSARIKLMFEQEHLPDHEDQRENDSYQLIHA